MRGERLDGVERQTVGIVGVAEFAVADPGDEVGSMIIGLVPSTSESPSPAI